MENNPENMENNPEAIKVAVLVVGTATFLQLGLLQYQEFQAPPHEPIREGLDLLQAVYVSGAAIFLSLGILEYQDQILELTGQVTQRINDAMGESFSKIWNFLTDIKEKIMSLPSVFYSTADGQDIEVSAPEVSTPEISTPKISTGSIWDFIPTRSQE